ncbi:MAG: methyl-accepting chemotaxis protein [Kiritimatiellia bacterium]|nr:methyl-accepting chemotaxis protein [Kiritimatiellia bacterium]
MKMSLRGSIVGLAVFAAVLPVLVTVLFIPIQRNVVSKNITEEMDAAAKYEAMQVVNMVYDMCNVTQIGIEKRLADHLKGANAELERLGGFSFSNEVVSWTARQQTTGEKAEVAVPKLFLGQTFVAPNPDFTVESPLVDIVTKFTHAYCTIFQKMNDRGDMLRVCTSVPDTDNKRAIGTFIPRLLPDGTENPVISKVLAGETYFGRALVMNQWNEAAYEPIWDSSAKKKVVGMLYIGFNLDEINRELRKAILDIVPGKTGYICVLGGKGDWQGHYIISKNGERDGENIWNTRDADGNLFIQNHISKALAAPEGKAIFERYPWQNKGEVKPRMKCAGIAYFKPWDWVIYATMYEDDNYGIIAKFITSTVRIMSAGAIAGAFVMVLAIILAIWLGSAIARPIGNVVAIAQLIAGGNLAEARRRVADKLEKIENYNAARPARKARLQNETEKLTEAVVLMTKYLASLVGQVQRSSVQMVSTATEISAASREQESTVTEFGASTTEIAAAVKEISATSQELAKTMQDIKVTANNTEDLADKGHSGLINIKSSIGHLAEATTSISTKLSAINEKAGAINNLVTTITKVADETNLLSLNASIEAEKAGEYGRGFAVVAREIRRLADQTAVSTLDIEQTVKEMQSSVSAGVMEMDKFNGEVAQWVKSVGDISNQLNQILEQIKVLTPRYESVNEGMRSQATGAQQISEAMTQLTEGARNTTESLKHFHEVTSQLKEAAHELQTEVARFKV